MAMNEPQDMENLSVLVPKADKVALANIAKRNGGASLGVVVRMAISEFIRQQRELAIANVLADAETEAYLRSEAYLRTVR